MTADQLREKYLKFFESKGHRIISGASLIPENDPTVLSLPRACTRWCRTCWASNTRPESA